jgi:uncharacterized protein
VADADTTSAELRLAQLRGWLAGHDRVVVAFSGGVDSTLLLRVAFDVLGDRVEAVTARSASLPASEAADATRLAARIGVAHRFIATGELDDPRYAANDRDRCYFCKQELFTKLAQLVDDAAGVVVCTGAIADDAREYRPGQRAADEAGVRAPLAEVGFSKAEVRAASRLLGLPTAAKPAYACLASRIPHGTEVTTANLAQVERAEAALHALGILDVRVRHHGDHARIEVPLPQVAGLESAPLRAQVVAAVRAAGYSTVEVDPAGYRPAGLIA